MALLMLATALPPAAAAQEQALQCGLINPMVRPELPAIDETLPPGAVRLDSQDAAVVREGITELRGNVSIWRSESQLFADEARYDASARTVTASGNIEFFSEFADFTAARAQTELDTGTSTFEDVQYYLNVRRGRGFAGYARVTEEERSQYRDVIYTSCEEDEEAWSLRARRLNLDHEEGIGTARNVVVRFMGVPFIYTPYIYFPIDDRRRTGLLIPTAGSSSSSGTDVQVPWYWNIAPNQDATITPRYMSKRGPQLGGEYRYLTQNMRGTVNAEYLPDDSEADRDRYFVRWQQRASLPRAWTLDTDYSELSDANYFNDLGGPFSNSSARFLQRRGVLRQRQDAWEFRVRAQDFISLQPDLDAEDEPLRRLPQVVAQTRRPLPLSGGVLLDTRAEAVHFTQRSAGSQASRGDLEVGLSMPLERAGYFVRPRAAWRGTAWDLDEAQASNGTSPSRSAPILSLDSGLIFERDLQLGDRPLLQTLEPRIFGLYVPERDQDDLPVLDTGLREFGYTSLFSTNRFSGADRLGDARQVTLGLTTRFFDRTNHRELLSASIAGIRHLADREVTLDNGAPDTRNTSDILAQTDVNWRSDLNLRGQIQWDPDAERSNRGLARLQYTPSTGHAYNLGYRQRRVDDGKLEQSDISAVFPVGRKWRAIGRWQYDLENSSTLETMAGVEYRNCCWGLRVLGRRHTRVAGEDPDTAIMVQLELRGLTSFGEGVDQLLEDAIVGYTGE